MIEVDEHKHLTGVFERLNSLLAYGSIQDCEASIDDVEKLLEYAVELEIVLHDMRRLTKELDQMLGGTAEQPSLCDVLGTVHLMKLGRIPWPQTLEEKYV